MDSGKWPRNSNDNNTRFTYYNYNGNDDGWYLCIPMDNHQCAMPGFIQPGKRYSKCTAYIIKCRA